MSLVSNTPVAPGNMLSFDIETTGLSAHLGHSITVICTEDYATGNKTAYEFARYSSDQDKQVELRDAVIAAFNAAESLCAFNGFRFDLPFMATALDISSDIVDQWKAKMTDIFEFCKTKYNHTFSLNALCEINCIPIKISTGLAAVKMARDGQFDELREYCSYDVEILNSLYRQRWVLNPRNHAILDLAEWTKPYVYPGAVDETVQQKMKLVVDAKTRLDQLRLRKKPETSQAIADSEQPPPKRCRMDLDSMLE